MLVGVGVAVVVVVAVAVVVVVAVAVVVVVAVLISTYSRLARELDLEPQSDERAPLSPLEPDLQILQSNRAHGSAHDLLRYTRIDQRSHRHVARDSRAGIEVKVQSPCHSGRHQARTRLSSEAMRPAPKPLSMFTTATPVAHEFSMVSSAAMPLIDAP